MDSWPIEYADQLVFGDAESNVAICCLWSLKERLKATLSPDDYRVIGNLYSRAGISPMLRNLLANPLIRYLIITGKSLTDSDEALMQFFKYGVDSNWKISGNGGQIDRDIPVHALDDVRQHVELIDMRNVSTREFAGELHQARNRFLARSPYAEARLFPKTESPAPVLPGEMAGFLIRGRTVFQVWCEAVRTVMTYGSITPTDYGLQQKEVLALLSIIEEPLPHLGVIPDWAPFNGDDVETYLTRFFQAEESADIAYNYGFRLQANWGESQIKLIATELEKSGHSRRALASLWDPVNDNKSADPPCITTIQCTSRDGQLNLAAYIRSNDIFRAYPLNSVALAELQARIAGQLGGIRVGSLSILSYSAHIYSDCWGLCAPAIAYNTKLQQRFEQDPRGSFVFRLGDGVLIADHYSPQGDLMQSLKAANATELTALITPFISRVDHALYLGREIDRLQKALNSGMEYRQDRV